MKYAHHMLRGGLLIDLSLSAGLFFLFLLLLVFPTYPNSLHSKLQSNHAPYSHSQQYQTPTTPHHTMASKATNTAGLTAREVDILCAMCQSLKSKPEV
jgi:hypothetical protein